MKLYYHKTDEAINNFIEFNIQPDEDIADIYKGRIKTLTDKLK